MFWVVSRVGRKKEAPSWTLMRNIYIEISIIKTVHAGGVFVKTGMSERPEGTANV